MFQNLVGAQTLIAGIILLCGWLYFSMFLPKGETQLSQLGFTCSVVTVSMYLSPLSSLVRENTRKAGKLFEIHQNPEECVLSSRLCLPGMLTRLHAHAITSCHKPSCKSKEQRERYITSEIDRANERRWR